MTNQSNSQINSINESQVTTSKAEIQKTNSNIYGKWNEGRKPSQDSLSLNLYSINKQKEETSFKFEFKSNKNIENDSNS